MTSPAAMPMQHPAGSATAYPPSSSMGNGAARYTLLRCRSCGGVTEISPVARKAGSARCPHCGSSLRWDCPTCKRTPWVDEPQCPCGFRMALREPVLRHFEAAQQAFRGFDFDLAVEHLERVLELYPDFTGARNGLARVRQRQAELDRLRLAYQAARAGARLAAARTAVEAWSRLADPRSPEIQAAWADLTPPLRRAEALVARARGLERMDPPAARDAYRQALEIAADLPEAMAGLVRTPPDPPAALDAQVLGDRIRLLWTPPPPDGCGPLTFVVLRKRNGVLAHPGDGTRIAEVATPEFDDLHVTPGDTVGYAVLSKRGQAESIAAISLGPFVFLADVKDVQVSADEHEVDLTWLPPPGVTEVRVIRKRGSAPSGPRDGERLAAASDCARDRGLDTDQVFYYAIYAIYKMPDGRLFPSPGIVASARTGAPITRQAEPPVAVREGPELPADPTELRATRVGSGLGYGSGSASGGTRVTLRWIWSATASSAIIVARQGSPPLGPSDPLATTANVPRRVRSPRMLDAHPTGAAAGCLGPGRARRWTVAHPRLWRLRVGWRALHLAGPGADGLHDPAGPSSRDDRLLHAEAPLAAQGPSGR